MDQDHPIPDLSRELVFQASRSSGPGGQNVNKVNTRVELRFNVTESQILTDKQKELILKKLSSKINSEGILIVASQSERSQLKNKEDATARFYKYLDNAFKKRKIRKMTEPTPGSVNKRLQDKKHKGEKKSLRNKPGWNE